MAETKTNVASLLSGGGSAESVLALTGRLLAGSDRTVAPSTEQATTRFASLESSLIENSAALVQLRTAVQAQADLVAANTKALASAPASQTGGGSAVANAVKSVGSTILSGMGLSPLLRGVIALFGGASGGSTVPAPLPVYTAPASVQATAGVMTGVSSPVAVDYDQNGQSRAVRKTAEPAQITVNVSAMDSRSFLERSDEIALAVRRAMLESSALNDVVSEL